jgi:hypothetical protein
MVMVLGFNHNIQYKGEIFHIQTEDSGIATPHIITLLYRGGTIIASKKTGYADIIKADNLEQVVEELMKDQHKEILHRLKSGEFDERAFGWSDAIPVETIEEVEISTVPPPAPDAPSDSVTEAPPTHQQSLDEIILDYLVAGDD